MTNHMMIVSIGNIQNFISNAVSTNDLYQSSRYVQTNVKNLFELAVKELDIRNNIIKKTFMDNTVFSPNYFIIRFTSDLTVKGIEDRYLKYLNNDKHIQLHPDLPVFFADIEETNDFQKDYQDLYRKLQARKHNRTQQYAVIKNYLCAKPEKICVLCHKRAGFFKQKRYICEPCKQKLDEKLSFPSTQNIAFHEYYAMIRADIDSLGKSVCNFKNIDEIIKLQDVINTFMGEINDTLKSINLTNTEHAEGQDTEKQLMVYGGGDDLLCFCPIKDVNKVLDKMDTAFNKLSKVYHLTYSKSVVFAHKKYPLRNVVQLSANRLALVKHTYRDRGKGGVDFTWIYRSSGVRSASVQLYRNKQLNKPLHDLLEAFQKEISRSIIWDLEEDFLFLGMDTTTSDAFDIENIYRNEITRIVKRKCANNVQAKQLLNHMMTIFNAFVDTSDVYIREYLQLLHIIEKWSQCLKKGEENENVKLKAEHPAK